MTILYRPPLLFQVFLFEILGFKCVNCTEPLISFCFFIWFFHLGVLTRVPNPSIEVAVFVHSFDGPIDQSGHVLICSSQHLPSIPISAQSCRGFETIAQHFGVFWTPFSGWSMRVTTVCRIGRIGRTRCSGWSPHSIGFRNN